MSNQTDDDAADDWSRAPKEARRSNRMGQLIQRALIPGSEAQKSAAKTLERNARLMLLTAALATVSTVVSAAGFIFVVIYLLRTPH
jgi:hypothetical protein